MRNARNLCETQHLSETRHLTVPNCSAIVVVGVAVITGLVTCAATSFAAPRRVQQVSPFATDGRIAGPRIEQLGGIDPTVDGIARLTESLDAYRRALRSIASDSLAVAAPLDSRWLADGGKKLVEGAAACAFEAADNLVVEIGGGVLEDLLPRDMFAEGTRLREAAIAHYEKSSLLAAWQTLARRTGGADATLCEALRKDPTGAPKVGVAAAQQRLAAGYSVRLAPFADAAKRFFDRARLDVENACDRLVQRTLDPPLLTVSGGVSLGSYMAGFLYFYTEYRKKVAAELRGTLSAKYCGKAARRLALAAEARPVRASGASAGSINAFLSAIGSCQSPVLDPHDSWFWRIWTTIGFGELLPGPDAPETRAANVLFREGAIKDKLDLLERAWPKMPWLDTPCGAEVGLPVTHTQPRQIEVKATRGPSMYMPRAYEHLYVRMTCGYGKQPGFVAIRPPKSMSGAFHPLLDDGRPKVKSVFNLLAASAAFPIAFPPRAVHMQVGGANRKAWMRDGGMMDNAPVSVVARLDAWDTTKRSTGARKTQPPLLFIDPDATEWIYGEEKDGGRAKSVLGDLGSMAALYVDSLQVRDFIEHYSKSAKGRGNVEIPLRTTPVAAQHFANFAGFFERSFREADFYFGMLDAWVHLHRTDLAFRLLQKSGRLPAIKSEEFTCLREARKAETDADDANDAEHGNGTAEDAQDEDVFDDEKPPLRTCEKLLGEASVDDGRGRRLRQLQAVYEASNALRKKLCRTRKKGCMTASEATDFFYGKLADEKFRWFDFANGAVLGTDELYGRLRDLLGQELHRLGARQPDALDHALLQVGGRFLANSLVFRPYETALRLGTGVWGTGSALRLDAAVSPFGSMQRALRLVGGIDLGFLSRKTAQFGLLAGAEVSILRWFVPASLARYAQLEVGAGVNWRMSWYMDPEVHNTFDWPDEMKPTWWTTLAFAQRIALRFRYGKAGAGWQGPASLELSWRWLW